MPQISPRAAETSGERSAAVLTIGGVTAAFAAAACCALPVLLTGAGIGSAWLGGIGSVAAPHRNLLLWLSVFSLTAGAVLLFRVQRAAIACGAGGGCTPRWLRALLLLGLVSGATLLWLGYSYV
ncbi:MAG: mercuric reductase [Sphingomonadales bacterium]|nr:mercuric reductase [Sphingomonadales bacterium]MDE2169315.1 mercuric reductase [Sphingomonadales bacterium]